MDNTAFKYVEDVYVFGIVTLFLFSISFALLGLKHLQTNTEISQQKAKNNFIYCGLVVGQLLMFIWFK